MSRKRIILLLSFCLITSFLVIAFWVRPQTEAAPRPRWHIWGYVTYEGNRDDDDYVAIWEDREEDSLRYVRIEERPGPSYDYKYLFPPQMPEGWYWVQGRGRLTNSEWHYVYFTWGFPDERVDLVMLPYEPQK